MRMASSMSATSAWSTSSHVGKRDRRLSHALSLFTSEVFCERIVKISSLRGSRMRPRLSLGPYSDTNRSWIDRALPLGYSDTGVGIVCSDGLDIRLSYCVG